MKDTPVRELQTEHYKRMTLAPKWLEFQGGTNLVRLADEKGISFNSQCPIEITAKKVFFTASNQAIINANQEFVARKSKSDNAIRIFGSEMHIYAPIRYLSGESRSFPPVKQMAQEEPNDGGLLGLVLGAVAVVAVGVIAGPEIALGCLLLGGCVFLMSGCEPRRVSSPNDSSSADSDSSSLSSSSSSEVTSGDEPSRPPNLNQYMIY